jgi:hypothetical protein
MIWTVLTWIGAILFGLKVYAYIGGVLSRTWFNKNSMFHEECRYASCTRNNDCLGRGGANGRCCSLIMDPQAGCSCGSNITLGIYWIITVPTMGLLYVIGKIVLSVAKEFYRGAKI